MSGTENPAHGTALAQPGRLRLAPLAFFAVLGLLLAIGLTLDPREVPSPLVGHPAPQFALEPVKGRTLGLALNYKDRPDDAARWLAELGDPYTRTGADLDGRVGIDWGVYGVPETFVVDKRGRIRDKIIGPVSPEMARERLAALVRRLQAEP